MFYKKKYQQAVAERDAWKNTCFERDGKIIRLKCTIRELSGSYDWLEKENEKLRKKDAFTFDKAEFQKLKIECAELKAEVEKLRKGAKK